MIKKIALAAIAAAATFMPVAAEVQPGTYQLLDTLNTNGILVTYNHDTCLTEDNHGSYRWTGMKREMRLCPGDTVDALDHEVVRHETIHAIQHCINVIRDTDTNTPVITDFEEFKAFVEANLSEKQIERIMEIYPKTHWATELEAFAGSNAYTAAELEALFLQACVAE